ncbi:hypothetical protein GCM10010439_40440 [Actinocorallia aurantiaca]|uniref:Uncharacterized protein n=1 Tax=Actinocorallia aurantiaca TaxID=46204 RepID=A0ABN3UBH1_9ACTN
MRTPISHRPSDAFAVMPARRRPQPYRVIDPVFERLIPHEEDLAHVRLNG